MTLSGIHHVTAITADAQANIDFYCGVLGLRLVKLTVNFDDPQSYHLYYGDELGRPGTIMTFFAWPGARRGRQGPPQVIETSFCTPEKSVDFWSRRLAEFKVKVEAPVLRFGETVLGFSDPDGMRLELVAQEEKTMEGGWKGGPVPFEHSIKGFCGVCLAEEGYEFTANLLTGSLGFRRVAQEGNRFRYVADDKAAGRVVDLLCVPAGPRGGMGAGTVHHVAFRTADDASQKKWHERLVAERFNVSPVMDRNYFHSIYFREPGGVLFEIATDGPGFAIDEAPESLGSGLKLPAQYEKSRSVLEGILPRLRLPGATK